MRVARILQKFVYDVFWDCTSPGRASDVAMRLPGTTLEQLLAYVEGRVGVHVLLEVFSIDAPRFAGVYFPHPAGEETVRWKVAASEAIEALAAIKVHDAA